MKEVLDIKLYTIKEFAEMIGVSANTARLYTFKYNLTTQRIGRSLYLTDRQIRNFLRNKNSGKLV